MKLQEAKEDLELQARKRPESDAIWRLSKASKSKTDTKKADIFFGYILGIAL